MMETGISISIRNIILDYPLLKEGKRFIKEKLTKRFSIKGNSFRALDNVNVDIKDGAVVGLIGPNGAGKSTLLRVIAGILPPDEGEIWIKGKVDLLAGVGAGMQGNLSGIENIELSCAIYGMDKKTIAGLIEKIAEFSGIGDFIYQPVRTYSSGMKARLGFSISAHIQPDVLLIDEVFAVGDGDFGKKSRIKITELINGGATVVMVSHNISLIKELCDKAYYMEDGKICSSGEIDEACGKYIHRG